MGYYVKPFFKFWDKVLTKTFHWLRKTVFKR